MTEKQNNQNTSVTQTEHETLNAEVYLSAVFNNACDPIFVKDAECRLILVNDAFCHLFGLSRSEIIGKTLAENVPLNEREHFLAVDRQVLEDGKENICEETLTAIGFESKIIKTKKNRFVDPEGNHFLIGVIHDITESKEAKSRIEKISTHVPGVIYQYQLWPDGHSSFPYASEGMHAIYGLQPDDVVNDATPVFQRLHPDDLARISTSIAESAKNLTIWKDVYRVNLPDGKIIWVEGEASPERKSDGSTLWHGHIRDITERKQAEIELDKAKVLFEAIFKGIPDAIVYADTHRNVTAINPAFSSILGFSIDDLAHKPTSIFYESTEEFERQGAIRFNLTAAEKKLPYIVNYRRKDGEIFPGETLGTVIKAANDSVIGYIGVIRDITERKQSEKAKTKVDRALRTLSQCNEILIRAVDESALLQDMCRLIVEVGGYRMAWVGYLQQDEIKSIKPMAHNGFEEAYLETVQITWADTERGQGPTGKAARTG